MNTSSNVAWRRLFPGVIAWMALLAMAGCGGGGGDSASSCTVTGVTASATAGSITAGTVTNLTATVAASGGCSTGVTWSVSPSTGTLTASGNTATFSSTAVAVYTITATSTADTTRSGATTVTVTAAIPACGTASGVVVQHTTDISTNQTWAGDGVTHAVPNDIAITGVAVLTISPCAIVSMGANASITVNGSATLLVAGSGPSGQVFFKRANASQAWGILRGGSATALLDLRYAQIDGAGSFGGQYRNPAIAIIGPGYGAAPVATLRVDHVTIEAPQGTGVYIDTNGAFTTDSQQLVVHAANDYPLVMTMMSLGSIPTGTYTGNLVDEVLVNGPNANVFANMTIHKRGIPVRIKTQGLTVAPSVNNGDIVTLTIEPGVTLKFPKVSAGQSGARVSFGGNGNSPNNPTGVLNAMGTAADPIVFTSGEAVPAPGDWIGLWLDTATNSRLDHVEISYAGAASGISSANCKTTGTPDDAALIVGDFETQYVPPSNLLTNSHIHHSAGHGIDAIWPNSSHNSPDLTATNTIDNVAFCRQTYNAVTPPATCPAQRGCTVQ